MENNSSIELYLSMLNNINGTIKLAIKKHINAKIKIEDIEGKICPYIGIPTRNERS